MLNTESGFPSESSVMAWNSQCICFAGSPKESDMSDRRETIVNVAREPTPLQHGKATHFRT
jgi:hypothetical protein